MSRIGKKPVVIPSGVKVNLDKKGKIVVEGPKGTLEENIPNGFDIKIEDNMIKIKPQHDIKELKPFYGLLRSLINNMVLGVSKGFEKRLEIVGVGYRANMKGNTLELLVGFSHPVVVEPPKGITFKVEGQQKISVLGFDKQLVGAVAAYLKSIRPPEPYKGKGIRYEGEHIALKAGKTAATTK